MLTLHRWKFLHPIVIAILTVLGIARLVEGGNNKYETDKWDVRDDISEGGWHVEYGREITETDGIEGGLAVLSGTTGVWASRLVVESLAGIERAASRSANKVDEDLKKEIEKWARSEIKKILGKDGGDTSKTFGRIDVKVGLARYRGRNREWIPNPLSRDGGYWQTYSPTFSVQPYIAVRWSEHARVTLDVLPNKFSSSLWVGSYVDDTSRVYFFAKDDYFRYSLRKKRFDKLGEIGDDGFIGVFDRGFDASVRADSGEHAGCIYFFKGNKYQRFRQEVGLEENDGEIGETGWNGLWKDGIDTATNHPNGDIYFFKGDEFIRWTVGKGILSNGRGKIGVNDFEGIWTNGIDAATDHPNGKIYFFKGNEYRRWDPSVTDPPTDEAKRTAKGRVDKTGVVGVDGWKTK